MSAVASPGPALEQSTSRPSLTHSATSSSTAEEGSSSSQLQLQAVHSSDVDTLVTPVDPASIQVQVKNSPIVIQSIDEEPEPAVHIDEKQAIRDQSAKKNRLNLSKSMQTLRKKKGAEKGRERSSSVSEKTPPPMPALPSANEKKTSVPVSNRAQPTAKPTRPPLQTKSSSGAFSSFLRKLTGRSSPASSPVSAQPPQRVAAAAPRKQPSATAPAPAPVSASSSVNGKPTLARLDTAGNASRQVPSPHIASPLPITPVQHEVEQGGKPTDPCMIPLPPSPTLELVSLEPSEFGVASASTAASVAGSTTRKKQERMLSLEGFDFEDEEESTLPPVLAPVVPTSASLQAETEQSSEAHDVVRPLAPIRIPSRNENGGPAGPLSATSTRSMATLSSSGERLVTPSSMTGPSFDPGAGAFGRAPLAPSASARRSPSPSPSPEKQYQEMRLAGSSPPRKAPVGVGLADLSRKESKWRKSVMGLSDMAKPAAKRQSTVRPPPTSHDAYMAQQSRIARNRQSCAPTLHSTASIAAAARGQMSSLKMSKEDEEVAETFFLS
ncbi:hypothetical protein IAU60_000348 [Kwoniella sp. DSM 27419]